jgi:hypothetical protein
MIGNPVQFGQGDEKWPKRPVGLEIPTLRRGRSLKTVASPKTLGDCHPERNGRFAKANLLCSEGFLSA